MCLFICETISEWK